MKYIENLDRNTKARLYELVRTSPNYKVRQRAHAILLSSKRHKIDDIADIFEVDRDTVSEWFKRWVEGGLSALCDKKRSGRPAKRSSGKETIEGPVRKRSKSSPAGTPLQVVKK